VRHVRSRAGHHLVERLDVLSVSIGGDGSAIQKISRAARRTLLRIHPAADASVIVSVVPTKVPIDPFAVRLRAPRDNCERPRRYKTVVRVAERTTARHKRSGSPVAFIARLLAQSGAI
jgi:hypothetical protein